MKKCNCIGPTIRIGREILCRPYAGFFLKGLQSEFSCILGGRVAQSQSKKTEIEAELRTQMNIF